MMSLFTALIHAQEGMSLCRLHVGVPAGAIFRSRLGGRGHRDLKIAPTANIPKLGGNT
jgi:hypothetical protein